MPKRSAGLLLYRGTGGTLEVLLVHPGGPFWASKDLGAWSLPKGEYEPAEEPLAAARRELTEETGFVVDGEFLDLGTVKQAGGKIVSAWAIKADCDPELLVSNTFRLEWPPRSGRYIDAPEVDRAVWFPIDEARERLLKSQVPFLERLRDRLEP